MANARKCDRCGKLYEGYNTENDSENINGIRTLNIDYQRMCYSHEAMDLCPECMESFWGWLRGKRRDLRSQKARGGR